MAQIQLNDQTFKAAERRAAVAGYSSVDEYVADLVRSDAEQESADETPNLDHLFTTARMAEIADAEAEIRAGKYFTAEQVSEHFKQKRATAPTTLIVTSIS